MNDHLQFGVTCVSRKVCTVTFHSQNKILKTHIHYSSLDKQLESASEANAMPSAHN